MGFDRHGQLHAGSIGLFDDPDELDAAEARREYAQEKHERKIEETVRKDDERGQRKAKKANRKRRDKEQGLSWSNRHFRRKDKGGKSVNPPTSGFWAPPPVPLQVNDEQQRERERAEAEVKRKRAEVDMYDAEDVDYEVDSPFYEVLGLLLVRGETAVDDRVVHKSQIRPAQDGKEEKDTNV